MSRMDRINNSIDSFKSVFDIEDSELKGMTTQEKLGMINTTVAELTHHAAGGEVQSANVGTLYVVEAYDEHKLNFLTGKGIAHEKLPIGTTREVFEVIKSKLAQQSPPSSIIDSSGNIWKLLKE